MRAAGQKMGELKAAAALAAKEKGTQVTPIVEPTVAKPKGKGPTSDDLAAMPPDQQEAKLQEIVDEFKGKKQLASEKGRLKNQKGAVIDQLAIRAGLSITGATIGAAMTPNDPITGAIIGGSAGLGLPSVYRVLADHISSLPSGALKTKSANTLGEQVRDFVTGALNLMPDYFRASYLAHPVNLPINAWVGPYRAAMMGAVESAIAGDKRGLAAMRMLLNKKVIQEWRPAWKEAVVPQAA